MAKRKTQMDKAVEQLQAKLAEITARYEAEKSGIETSIATLRNQPARKPRTAKPQPVEARVG